MADHSLSMTYQWPVIKFLSDQWENVIIPSVECEECFTPLETPLEGSEDMLPGEIFHIFWARYINSGAMLHF